MSIQSSVLLEKALTKRGLVPIHCRLLEVSVKPSSALVIRYEKYVDAEELSLVADAIKEAAAEGLADDERNRKALEEESNGR